MPSQAPQRVLDRIYARVEKNEDGCWLWPGATSVGYGRISWTEGGKQFWAGVHRVVYAAHYGDLADDLDVDHLCHDPATCVTDQAVLCNHRRCCNPAHLRAVSRRENLLRGGTVTASRRAVVTCPAGHKYTDENTLTDKQGRRSCKECTYERNRAYYHANRERRREYNKAWRAKQREAS